MKFKSLLSIVLASGAFCSFAQTHVEGVEYYKADQFDNAKELLERNFNNPGTDKAIANFYLGEIALHNNNIEQAASYFEKGVAENPEYGFNYVGQGAILLKNGDVKGAEKLFKTAENQAKKDPAIQIQIARAYYYADPVAYTKEIEKRLEKARRININAPEIFIFEGDRFADQKDWGQAGSKYEMAAQYNPMGADAYVKYANLFTQVNPQYAIKMLKQLLSQNPTSALGQREIANAYYNNKDYSNAAELYGKYVKNPNHFKQDEDRYAFLLFYGQQYQAGFDFASQLLANNRDNFTARRYQFMNAAQLPEMKDQLITLAETLYEVHKSNPANKFAPIDYTLVAEEFQLAKRLDKALEVIEEAMQENPENASFNKQLAMIYVDENNFPAAAEAYKGYLKKIEEPGYNDLVQQSLFSYFAGISLMESDSVAAEASYEDAVNYAKQAAEILPSNYKPLKIQGDVAKQRASKAEFEKAAVPFYTEAIALLEAAPDPSKYASDAKEMYNYMGNYCLDCKDVEKAKEYFNKYLKYDPNNEQYRKFVEKL